MFIVPIFLICLSLFLLSAGLFVYAFRQGQWAVRAAKGGRYIFALATILLTYVGADVATSPNTTESFHVSTILLAVAIGWLTVFAWQFWNLNLIGAFTAPIAAILLMVDAFFSNGPSLPLNAHPSGPLLLGHIVSAVVGQAFAVAACGTSLLLLWQERKLKQKQLADVPLSYPAMDSLANALSSTLWIGFTFISASLITGAIIVKTSAVPVSFSTSGKSSWAILVWGWYLTILVLRNVLSYPPHRIARLSLVGFVLLALSWFGMGFSADLWSGL
jgi:ABC-type uncharacterized transport system permease subunit